MRGTIEGLQTPHPLAAALPGLYREPEVDQRTGGVAASLAERFTAALDEVLAPVFSSVDNLGAYLDPRLAPPDFLEWLARWVGLALDETWPLERRRALVAHAVRLYQRRGTARGLAEHVAIFAGVVPDIEESGGVAWSTTAGSALPGSAEPRLVLRLSPAEAEDVDVRRLQRLVDAARPAHVPAQVEVTGVEVEVMVA